SPQNLYTNPVNLFVAGFMGSPQMNFIDSVLRKTEDGKFAVEFGSEDTKTSRGKKYYVEVPESKITEEAEAALNDLVNKEIIAGVRPEDIHDEEMFLSAAKTGIIEADVEITEMMGAETYLYLNCEGISLTARVDPRSTARPQDTIKVAIDANKIHIFDKETEKTIVN
ncbi:MAG: TOBE domain-containing protein, partial [Oscillospiraceae bacterium]|nr:TOBE domain-containing protein [Oscillospiraceae bacterium]